MTTDPNKRQAVGAGIGLLLGILVVLVLVLLVRTWSLADAIRESQRDNNAAIAAIEDCTSPEGECFARSEERYAAAVSGINAGTLRIIAAALACEADGVTERKALAECTTQRAARPAP